MFIPVYIMQQQLGACSHPDCMWQGQKANYNKHKDGVGQGEKRRAGHHEGCHCCEFVSTEAQAPVQKLSLLQSVMVVVGRQEDVPLHAHVQGEFNRRAGMAAKYKYLSSRSFAQAHAEFLQNPHPVQDFHTQTVRYFMDTGRTKTEAASPAALALLLQTPERPASIMKPFR